MTNCMWPNPNMLTLHLDIPTLTAYNALLSSLKPMTEVNVLPLVAAPAYEWQTLITALKQTEQIHCMALEKDSEHLRHGLYE